MASIDEVRYGISEANSKAGESMGALAQAKQSIDDAQAMLQRVMQGSSQHDVDQARAHYADAANKVDEVQQAVHAAIQAAEDVASRL